ncbi:uncharacterized protein [Hoplias malabaricus]|uniref:uncharacterized protein isoform X2 n=1 Tax=Hoplias malabaricus TaxID=27720 RepID=UPI003462E677
MDSSSVCSGSLSDDQVDVAQLIEEEFQKQILLDSSTLGEREQTKGNGLDLWDSLWQNVDPVVDQLVNQAAKPVFNPVFCLSCDTMFLNKLTLEEHVCPFVSFICLCGITFSSYPEMLTHSMSHNNKSTYVVNHKSAIQNRIISVKQQEVKLKVLEQTAKDAGIVKSSVPLSHTSPSSTTRYVSGKTVNLWKRFRPIVKLETIEKFHSQKPCKCLICSEEMCNQDILIEHVHVTHNSICIYGCSRCGTLLIGSIPPKILHRCGSIHNASSRKFTTGKILRNPLVAEKLYMPYACPFCNLKFCHQVHLSNHIRFNHTNIYNQQEDKSQLNSAKGVQSSSPSQTQKLRCALCGKMCDTLEMLGQHWCKRKLMLLKPEMVAKLISEKVPHKFGSSSSGESGSGELTFTFRGISNMKTYGHKKLLTIKTEPVEVNLMMTQTDFSQMMPIKTEPDMNDNDNVLEKAQTEKNGHLYQNCSAPNGNNLKYLLSSI